MIADIKELLHKLQIPKTGIYDNHSYIVKLEDSNEYAKFYTLLDKNAVNTEYPVFSQNTNKNTTKIVNYFEAEVDSNAYLIFLTADFANEQYYLRIREKLLV